jgi:flagellin-like hook-associated protein FlgL
MAERIVGDHGNLMKDYRIAQERLNDTMTQLATGKQRVETGGEADAYDQVLAIGIDRNVSQAKQASLQSRMSWYQTSIEYLMTVRDLLTTMSETTIRARSGATSSADREVLDTTFQSQKQEIAAIIDGYGGVQSPAAQFNGVPLFQGFLPDVEIGADVPDAKVNRPHNALYTGMGRDGFDTIPLIGAGATSTTPSHSATATAGTATTITLGAGAAAINNLYAGMTLTVTSGTGSGQSTTIASYDAQSRVATVTTPFTTLPDATSVYQIDSNIENKGLPTVGNVNTLRTASWLWGANNDRGADDRDTFRALTPEEQTYRTANAIPNTDLEAKTYQERSARRELNIFDAEFGALRTDKQISRMQQQLERAVNLITGMITEQSARAESLQQQYYTVQKQTEAQDVGIETFGNVDAFKTSSLLKTLSVDPSRIIELAARLTKNIGKLNDLVRSGGTR